MCEVLDLAGAAHPSYFPTLFKVEKEEVRAYDENLVAGAGSRPPVECASTGGLFFSLDVARRTGKRPAGKKR
jgi:hypothetical protein